MWICTVGKLTDHDKVGLVHGVAVEDILCKLLLRKAGLALRIVTGRRDNIHEALRTLTERVFADVVNGRGRVCVVFIDDEIARCTGVLVLRILR